MAHPWPKETVFKRVELDVQDRTCRICDKTMHVCDHRDRRIFTLDGPVHLLLRLVQCPHKSCPGHHRTFSPEAELTITMPYWVIGWDVFSWVGHRRFARHWSVPQIRAELSDSYRIALSEDAVEKSIRRYQVMLAARQQDPNQLREDYQNAGELMLSIDGLQPEKGHETLYVVRELSRRRVWFAESLISSAEAEVRRLLVRARQWSEDLGKPIRLWMSDKQDAFVTGIAGEFPGVPHRYCQNHFLRDVAKPVLDQDSRAKVKMRSKIRGLRSIERGVLERQRQTSESPETSTSRSPETSAVQPNDEAGKVTLDYCTAVRGILNDDQGGPLHPPGIRMVEGLAEVRESLARNLDLKKGGLPSAGCSDWPDALIEG